MNLKVYGGKRPEDAVYWVQEPPPPNQYVQTIRMEIRLSFPNGLRLNTQTFISPAILKQAYLPALEMLSENIKREGAEIKAQLDGLGDDEVEDTLMGGSE